MALGIDPTNDYVFRLVYGDPANSDLLIHLLNAILQLPSPITHVEILNPFIEQEFELDKLAVLDIKARDSAGRLLNIEMQTSVTSALKERLVYYAASLFSGQLKEGDKYSALCPTIGICILSAKMFPNIQQGHLRFVLSNLEHGLQLTQHFQIHTVELPKYNLSAAGLASGDNLDHWAYWFRHAAELDAGELRTLLPELPFQKATGILEMISRTPSQRDVYEARQKAIRDYASAIEDARQQGIEQGIERGIERGIEQGLEKGIDRGHRLGKAEQVKMLQALLNEPVMTESQLLELDLSSLNAMAENLQSRLMQRHR